MNKSSEERYYKKAIYVARKYYKIYKHIYLLESVECKDLEQEASLTVFEVLSNAKYKDKPADEILSIINQAIRFRLNVIRNTIQKHKNIFNTNMIDTIIGNFNPTKKEEYNLTEIKEYVSEKEYKVLYKKLIEGKSFREIAKEIEISFQAVAQIYKKSINKIKKLEKLPKLRRKFR